MFDRYLICGEGFKNVKIGSEIAAFQISVRITYYRGVTLSAIEGFIVTVDGEEFPCENNIFTVRDKSYSYAEMQEVVDERWELGEIAELTVPKLGGLSPGPHIIEVLELLRISYLPALSEGRDKKTLILAT